MKTGRTLQELAREVEAQEKAKEDFIVRPVDMEYRRGEVVIQHDSTSHGAVSVKPNRNFETQLAQYLDIPEKFVARLRREDSEPMVGLLDSTVNTLLRATTAKRMVRTLNGQARAFLSDRYRRIDNYQVLSLVLPILGRVNGVTVESCEVTETSLYLKVVNRSLEAEVSVGDSVQAGLVISNSEVGKGSLKVMPLLYRLVCSNGMIVNDAGQRTYHLGSTQDQGLLEMYSDRTLALEDRALESKLEDIMKAAVDAVQFNRVVDVARQKKEVFFASSLTDAAEEATKEYGLNKEEGAVLLTNYISNHDFSLWGLANAFTQTAQSVESYDRATELETIGYKVLNMDATTFKRISTAGLRMM